MPYNVVRIRLNLNAMLTLSMDLLVFSKLVGHCHVILDGHAVHELFCISYQSPIVKLCATSVKKI